VRFVVLGAGAIGGVVGGRLFQQGHEVTLVARGDHGRALAGGLVLESPDGRVTLPVRVAAEPSEVGWHDDTVVLLGVKGQHTDHALEQLVVAAPPDTPVVCMQNGVENERRVLRRFPNIYGMCVMCPATYLEPGVVRANAAPVTGLLDLGRYPTGVDATGRAIARALAASTFRSEPRADIMRWKYRKLIMNLGNAVEALCGPSGRASPPSAEARREGEQVLAAAGIDVITEEEDILRRGDLLQVDRSASGGRGGGSTWQSLARGAGSDETDYLNGEIVLLGALHGVPTPANATLARLVHQAVREGRPPGSFDLGRLTELVGARPTG
jgi:2-dehydropantoate 2-reductase